MAERFSASVAGRHMACHASAHLDKAILGWVPPVVDPMKGAKGKGTNIHAIFELAWEYPASDLKHIASVLEYVAELCKGRRFTRLVEETVTATWLATQPNTTADLVLFTQEEIHVLDTKTGRIPVPVYDNAQMLFYDVCYAPLAPKAKGVTNHILQPWADNIESEFVPAYKIKKFMDEAIAAEAAIAAGDVTFGPSDECKFCPAYPHSRGDKGKPLCPATMQILYPSVVDEDAILNDL